MAGFKEMYARMSHGECRLVRLVLAAGLASTISIACVLFGMAWCVFPIMAAAMATSLILHSKGSQKPAIRGRFGRSVACATINLLILAVFIFILR